jgi:quinol monooxygenase YgiN
VIIIAGTLDFEPDQRDAALEEGNKLVSATRKQRGCLDYVWSADLTVPGRVYVFERWEDEAALKAHFDGEYYLAMRETLGRFKRLGTDIWKYRPDCIERVYDENRVPRADFFTDEREA